MLKVFREPLPRAMIYAVVLVALGSLMPLNSGLTGGSGWTKWELGITAPDHQAAVRALAKHLCGLVGKCSVAGLVAALSFSRGQND